MRLRDAIRDAVVRLKDAGIDSAPKDARILASLATGIAYERMNIALEDEVAPDMAAAFERLVAARCERRPMSHLSGRRWFLWHEFKVTPETLDPRPETEEIVLAAIGEPFSRVLDLGTGTGCILLSLLHARPEATGIGTDISPGALAVAQENAARLGLDERARFIASDWFQGVEGRFDLIVSNPPYIAEEEMAGLAPEVRDWEPHLALTPGGDGLDAYRAIATGAAAHLVPGGRIALEIGPTQAGLVSELLRAAGFGEARVLDDRDGRNRVVIARF